jgi:hypothetical protein
MYNLFYYRYYYAFVVIIITIIFIPSWKASVHEPRSNIVPEAHYTLASGKYILN